MLSAIGIVGCVHLNGDRSPDARKMSNYLRNARVEASIKYLSAHDETSFVSRARQNEDAAIPSWPDLLAVGSGAASKYNSKSAIVCKQPDFAGICKPREAAELRSAFSLHVD